MLNSSNGILALDLGAWLKIILGWTTRALAVYCLFAQQSEDFWEKKISESREELLDKDRPNWVGGFSCSIPPDQTIYAYTSSNKGFIAIRLIGVFGVQESKFVNLREKEGLLYLDRTEQLLNCEPLSTILVCVKFGPRTYLVPYGKIHGFCLNVKEGKKLDEYLHDSAELNTTENKLVVDSKFEIFTKLPPVKIALSETSIVRDLSEKSRIVLEDIESFRLYPGMQFACQNGFPYTIESVEGNRAEAILNYTPASRSENIPDPTVLVTWR